MCLAELNLNTDRKRLLQCLINFLSNAVKFAEAGTVTIVSRSADAQVSVSVADTGIGIAEKDLPRLFEPFERLETHLRVEAGGMGLGLYLTKKLATEVLHRNISVKSSAGQGNTFTITIPEDIREAWDTLSEEKGGDII
jgi:signal transduction histidine kinase